MGTGESGWAQGTVRRAYLPGAQVETRGERSVVGRGRCGGGRNEDCIVHPASADGYETPARSAPGE
jgi:hypothetical protein